MGFHQIHFESKSLHEHHTRNQRFFGSKNRKSPRFLPSLLQKEEEMPQNGLFHYSSQISSRNTVARADRNNIIVIFFIILYELNYLKLQKNKGNKRKSAMKING